MKFEPAGEAMSVEHEGLDYQSGTGAISRTAHDSKTYGITEEQAEDLHTGKKMGAFKAGRYFRNFDDKSKNIAGGFPAALLGLVDSERIDGHQLCCMAEEMGVDLQCFEAC